MDSAAKNGELGKTPPRRRVPETREECGYQFRRGKVQDMYTLFLKYTIDPDKLEAWRAYAEAEFAPITESGGKITGYYAPTSRHGTPEAFARFVDRAHAAGLAL